MVEYDPQYINSPNTFFDRCQWNGFLPWPPQLWHLLSQEIMPAKKHAVWVCNLSTVSTLWGPQSVSNDMGQHPVPEEPGLVPDPVIVWEGDNRAMLEEVPTKSWTGMACKCIVGVFKIDENKTYWSTVTSNRGRAEYLGCSAITVIQLNWMHLFDETLPVQNKITRRYMLTEWFSQFTLLLPIFLLSKKKITILDLIHIYLYIYSKY